MSKTRVKEAQALTSLDKELAPLKDTILSGWPEEKSMLPEIIQKHWAYRDELAVHEDLVFKGNRLFVPEPLRPLILKHIHMGHRGVQASLQYITELSEGRKIKRHINQLLKSEVNRKNTVTFSDSPQLPVQYQTGEKDEEAILPAASVATAHPPQVTPPQVVEDWAD
ncbi:hypothetical protein GE061_017136 [Apolygus lucorum]|uniref:Integrase zinc-binding domain-containing protein n=1 Tax=Apolygus lucorum TaxID=248454 RepID=A0A8S9XK99_APOLU|nr:hypothetical protein GE061_017136 [Apolygus lucorum]